VFLEHPVNDVQSSSARCKRDGPKLENNPAAFFQIGLPNSENVVGAGGSDVSTRPTVVECATAA
jgi:hypothetical protein